MIRAWNDRIKCSTGIVEGEGKVAVDGLNAIVGLFVQDKMEDGDSVAQLSQFSATGRWRSHYRPDFGFITGW